jgi:hypothetical protein
MSPKQGRVVIPSGQSESGTLELVTETVVGVYMPDQWDAADMAFSASQDGTNFADVYDFGSPLTVQADAGWYVPLDYTKFVGVAFLKIKSVSGGSPLNQTAEREIVPVFRTLE